MMKKRLISLVLAVIMLMSVQIFSVSSADNTKTFRTVYLHAQGEDPAETVNTSTVYMGENTDIYFAIDDPNKGDYENGVHNEPEYDLNGYTLRICFDPEYFDFAESDTSAPIYYMLPDENFGDAGKGDEDIGDDMGSDVPQTVGYFVFRHGSGSYTLGARRYATAYITVFYSGGYVPQKEEGKLWYNLARLSLVPKKTGSTDVFVDMSSDNELYMLELFAKNNKSDELSDQTFDYNAINGGFHHIIIKDKSRPEPPIATPSEGTYIESVEVTLTAEDGCVIYYTTDGTDPAVSSTKIPYTGPFTLTTHTKIRICAMRTSDGKYSNTVTYDYTILPDRPYLFDTNKQLIPDIYTQISQFEVLVSDKQIYGSIPISDDSEVYYTFSNADAKAPVIGTDPEKEWVHVSKLDPRIVIDRARTVRLITKKLENYSEPATYILSIRPAAPVANYDSGEYDGKIDVTLSTMTEGAVIYYTTDGSDPITSLMAREYTKDVPITIAKDTTLRAVAFFDGIWSEKSSYYYIFVYDDFGISAFYPSGVYEGNVNVTLTSNNPDHTILYHTGDGNWKEYTDMLTIEENTDIIAKAVAYDDKGNVVAEGNPYVFTYKIKPLPPVFAPESTQFTNSESITIYTPESTESTYKDFDLYYTTDGSDPSDPNNSMRVLADEMKDSAIITIDGYTVVTAVVLKNKESYSSVVKHSYDIVKMKPVKPLTTLVPGYYIHEIGGEAYSTQFMPVPGGTQIYYTISYDGSLCPDPVPNTAGTYLYNGTDFINIRGNTVIKAVAVNSFGAKSDIGIFSYTVSPEAPIAAPSATINSEKLPVVPVDAVKGSTVNYTVGSIENKFVNESDERFYIDTATGKAYRDADCTIEIPTPNSGVNTGNRVTLSIFSEMDGVQSDENRYVYRITDDVSVLAPPYADKETGVYEEIKIDEENNLLEVKLYSLNRGGVIKYRLNNEGEWISYTDGESLKFKEDTILQLRYERNGYHSAVASYVYNFIPLAPIIELPSGTYLRSDEMSTALRYDDRAPTDKTDTLTGDYSIWYRSNGDDRDYRYRWQERPINKTMSFKAYVLNGATGRVSKNTIHYYIIEDGSGASGRVDIVYPYYDGARISAHVLGQGDYAEGIKLITNNRDADICYSYTYTKVTDGGTVRTNTAVYDVSRPIIPTALMDKITIEAWLENEDGKIEGSDAVFDIDFVHLNVPTTSLEESGKVEFPKNTKYTLINEYENDDNVILYYTLDGSDPTDPDNTKRKAYGGEKLTLSGATTVKAVYYSACGKCKVDDINDCRESVYGPVGTYKYTVPTTTGGGTGSSSVSTGGGTKVVDKTRKYTKDIFGNEHPTHIKYINGYPDGSVQPEGDITREEMTAILYRIMNHEYEEPFVATGDAFPDVKEGRWSAHDIEYMADKGIVKGYLDGEFKPARHLTRAEFAALIFRFTGVRRAEVENPFSDLDESHWAYYEILSLVSAGLIQGYDDGTYKPEDNISRAEVMTVVNKILGRKPIEAYVKSLGFNPYNDLPLNKWYYVEVMEATITHNYYLNDTGFEYKWEDWK